mgnify:CR=1 FL=1
MNAPRFTDSPEQAKVVNAPTGDDVLVVAGAGSGKTYTMTRRIINLIAQGVPAERILGLTSVSYTHLTLPTIYSV